MQFINSEYCFFFIIIIYIVKQNMNILQLTCFIQMHIHLNINHQNINKIIIFQCTDEKNIYTLIIGAELTIGRCRFDQVPFNLGPK